MKYKLDRERIDKLPDSVVVDELRRVAEHYGLREFTRHEFDKVATSCKGTKVLNVFGSWKRALEATRLQLKPHKAPRKDRIPEQDLFAELERVWHELGHRPSRNEFEASSPKFSFSTYKTRFGGWVSACAAFIDFKSGGSLLREEPEPSKIEENREVIKAPIPPEEKRYIPLKLRLAVLKRDNFKCAFCGKSPATHSGVGLQIDHIVPFSKSGRTKLGNLQTLCDECNLGKGSAL